MSGPWKSAGMTPHAEPAGLQLNGAKDAANYATEDSDTRRKAMPKIELHTSDLEVEKPSGGGRGPNELYIVEVIVDGVKALHLQRFHFKQPGQMAALAAGLKQLIEKAGQR